MAGQIAEFLGFKDTDRSAEAMDAAASSMCPFLSDVCTKEISISDGTRRPSGACTVRQRTKLDRPVIFCPHGLYADSYQMLDEVAHLVFGVEAPKIAGRFAVDEARRTKSDAIAVFGHRWGGELRLPKKNNSGSYYGRCRLDIGLY